MYLFKALLLGMLPFVCSVSMAEQRVVDENGVASLRGIHAIGVIAVVSGSTAFKDQVSENRVQTLVELTLQEHGMNVTADPSKQDGYLYVTVTAVDAKTAGDTGQLYGFQVAVTFAFWQDVLIKRDRTIACPASTWTNGYVGFWGIHVASAAAKSNVVERSELFVNDYLAANP